MKKALRYVAGILLVVSSIGLYITNRLMYMKKKDDNFILEREKQAGRFNPLDFDRLPKRELSILSPFGYTIKTIIVEPHKTNNYMIFCHGVTENKTNSVKYMNVFLNRGFNAVIYDHRRHGESGGKTTSFGYYEKFDLMEVVKQLKQEKGKELILGIHGESMGAATMLLYAGTIEDGANFYIADCSYSTFKDQLAHQLKEEKNLPPRFFLPIADLFLRIRDRYSLKDISPLSVIEKIEKPILFIHSQKDDFILPSMTLALYERKKGPKKLFLAPNGLHAQSYNENKEEYETQIDEFLNTYAFLDTAKLSQQ